MRAAGYPKLSYAAEWPELKRSVLARLDQLFVEIAKPGTSLDDTNVLRGRIAELRAFLDEVEPSVFIPSTPPAADHGSGY